MLGEAALLPFGKSGNDGQHSLGAAMYGMYFDGADSTSRSRGYLSAGGIAYDYIQAQESWGVELRPMAGVYYQKDKDGASAEDVDAWVAGLSGGFWAERDEEMPWFKRYAFYTSLFIPFRQKARAWEDGARVEPDAPEVGPIMNTWISLGIHDWDKAHLFGALNLYRQEPGYMEIAPRVGLTDAEERFSVMCGPSFIVEDGIAGETVAGCDLFFYGSNR